MMLVRRYAMPRHRLALVSVIVGYGEIYFQLLFDKVNVTSNYYWKRRDLVLIIVR